MKNSLNKSESLVNFFLLSEIILLAFLIKFIQISHLFFKAVVYRDNAWLFQRAAYATKDGMISKSIYERNISKISELLQNAHKKCIRILSDDRLNLSANVFMQPAYSCKWVIIVHGYSGQNKEMYAHAVEFFSMGYNVLLPDLRGHGKSEGKHICFGWFDRFDILSWAKYIIKTDNNAQIALYGVSMGGSAVLMAGGEIMPKNIKCIISDCAFTSASEELFWYLKYYLNLPSFPFVPLADIICLKYAGFGLSEASALSQVEKCETPLLFIHGGRDRFVPTYMVYKLYKKARCKKALYVVKKAGHGISSEVAGKRYWNRVEGFLNRHII
jgi:fermentation-respiration switch protein FrsA (DUF1100 family)